MTSNNGTQMTHLAVFALDKLGRPAFAGDVKSGLLCECICPHCKEPVIAKHCTDKRSHFAHQAGSDCSASFSTGETAPETQLHLQAKYLLAKLSFSLPKFWVGAHVADSKFRMHTAWARLTDIVRVMPGTARIEARLENVVPDLIVSDGTQSYLLEVAVTHRVNHEKLLKLRKLNIPTAELNIKHLLNVEDVAAELERAVLNEANWTWVYHPREDELRAHAQTRAEQKAEEADAWYDEEQRQQDESDAADAVAKAKAEQILAANRLAAAKAWAEAERIAQAARDEAARVAELERQAAVQAKAQEDWLARIEWEAAAPARAEAERIAQEARQAEEREAAALRAKIIADYKAKREEEAAMRAEEMARRYGKPRTPSA
jgi:chemotaxis protein histidine kinase CheA